MYQQIRTPKKTSSAIKGNISNQNYSNTLFEKHNINKMRTTPYNRQSNRKIERFHRTLKETLITTGSKTDRNTNCFNDQTKHKKQKISLFCTTTTDNKQKRENTNKYENQEAFVKEVNPRIFEPKLKHKNT